MILQFSSTVNGVITVLARLVGLAVLAGILAGSVALVYRWYVRERVPAGLALLFALAGVAIVLNTTPLLAAEIAAGDQELAIVDALFNIAAFLTSTAVGFAGIRVGDHLGTDVFTTNGSGRIDTDVSEIVQTVGRVIRVELPDDIDDVVGYDPVPDATKEALAGRRLLFPRRLSKTELRERLVSRLKTDYGVGHVDVEIGDHGAVEFLAVGSRAAGIGPTLPPATNAVAIRADPANAASAGDLVQVWETDPVKRVLTGELRGVAGDVVTVAIDAADTPRLSPTERYKLVTLPVEDRPDREFASLLRAADETLATITVGAGSDLDGTALQNLNVTVAAVTREGEATKPLPARGRTLRTGDVVYAIATPELLRKLEAAAEARDGIDPGEAVVTTSDGDADDDEATFGNDGSGRNADEDESVETDASRAAATETGAVSADPNETAVNGAGLTEADHEPVADDEPTTDDEQVTDHEPRTGDRPTTGDESTTDDASDGTAVGDVGPLTDPLPDDGEDETNAGGEEADDAEYESDDGRGDEGER